MEEWGALVCGAFPKISCKSEALTFIKRSLLPATGASVSVHAHTCQMWKTERSLMSATINRGNMKSSKLFTNHNPLQT